MSKRFSENNMTSILSKLKAELDETKSQDVSVTILASGWNNRQQTITIPGLSATQNGIICLAQNISAAEYEAAFAAGLFVSGQKDNTLIVSYIGDTPACDIPATIILLN